MYQATEMATAVKYRLNLVNIVFNNDSYGNVQRAQQEEFGGNVIGSDLSNPDFVRFAESFGAPGYARGNHRPVTQRPCGRHSRKPALY